MKRIEQFIKNIFKINAKQLIVLMLGLVIAHLGVALFILTNLGSDPYNVLIQGISRTIKMSHGTCHQGLSLFILIIIFIVARSYIKIGTILCMIFGGPIIDFFGKLLGNIINESLPFFVRILISCIGCIVLSRGRPRVSPQ